MIALTVRIVFSLVVVLALMWGLARLARGPLSRYATMGGLAVVARQQLSRNAALVVVRLGERGLLLGVTDQQVRLIGEASTDELDVVAEPQRRRGMALPRTRAAAAETGAALSTVDGGPLAGSALSRRTWKQFVELLRERTARQP